jgi:tRNA-splicing ligase RtcB (3'-phosphate/5'-hydroxy nucleic acid ligase)
MATGTYIVRGLGNESAFNSASHGAGRKMSRSRAKKSFTVGDLLEQTRGVECRKDAGVIDEIPGAYKDLESVIDAQSDLVEIVAHLRQLICVKG